MNTLASLNKIGLAFLCMTLLLVTPLLTGCAPPEPTFYDFQNVGCVVDASFDRCAGLFAMYDVPGAGTVFYFGQRTTDQIGIFEDPVLSSIVYLDSAETTAIRYDFDPNGRLNGIVGPSGSLTVSYQGADSSQFTISNAATNEVLFTGQLPADVMQFVTVTGRTKESGAQTQGKSLTELGGDQIVKGALVGAFAVFSAFIVASVTPPALAVVSATLGGAHLLGSTIEGMALVAQGIGSRKQDSPDTAVSEELYQQQQEFFKGVEEIGISLTAPYLTQQTIRFTQGTVAAIADGTIVSKAKKLYDNGTPVITGLSGALSRFIRDAQAPPPTPTQPPPDTGNSGTFNECVDQVAGRAPGLTCQEYNRQIKECCALSTAPANCVSSFTIDCN